ncbi:MAG: P-loop NTPase fold protein [Eubacteriales bacterium]|nr:P-loop NTPase fold protein [Eubacteriales bacterium]
MAGLIDKPINELKDDHFEVKHYIEALSNFIKNCDTPMTIAIQGDWGSGKTSIMNMVKNELKDLNTIWFNTWQFSKFDMDDKLSFSLLMALAEQLDKCAGRNEMKSSLKDIVATAVWRIAAYSADAAGASLLAEDAMKQAEKNTQEDCSLFSAVVSLKFHFQEMINKIAENKNRVVIFIDDLDRLEPSRALDVLEVLKLFLDCENCVYVLAIDYGVVTRGVKEKYGDDLQGKQFFDKIIQLPFYMPVAHYDIKKFVKKSVNKEISDQDIETYVNLIRNSVGCNPRTMKRLFNAFELISMIYEKNENENQRTLLFALLCLQLTYEDVYNYLVENINTFSEDDYNNCNDHGLIYDAINQNTEDEKKDEIFNFMDRLMDIIADGKKQIKGTDVERFKTVLRQSTTTNNTAVTSKSGKAEVTEDIEGEKTLTPTDKKYKILCLGSKFQLGYGKEISVAYEGENYKAKMHRTAIGRIDGLSGLYNDNKADFEKDGEIRFHVQYKAAERKVILTKIP